jgi:hypothetical protein
MLNLLSKGSAPREGSHDGHQLIGVDGFGNVHIETGRGCSVPILGFPVRRESHGRNLPPLGVEAAHLPNERVTIRTRHFDVGDENVRPPILDDSQSLCRRRTYAHVGTGVDQDGHDEIKALSVVIDGEQSKSHK